ncbi:MAG TPA: GvpL/GvpF family gas vesicle protein [Thermoanaerobaculia bacterium]|nr:GvpL/GvpF family gas vesicle protein [Thermoanaerobaculia bacterium]
MKSIAIGVHLQRADIEPLADAVPVSSLYLSAIAVAEDQSLSDRDLLVRVTSTRAALLDKATFVAIRYGFSFRTASEAEAKCAPHVTRWKALLEEHRRRVEFTLKVAAPGTARPDRHDFKSGADYIRALHDARDATSIPASFKEKVEAAIVPLAVRHRWMKRDTTSVELAGLIERESLSRLAEAGESLKMAAPDVPFLLSAPWPLEVFAEE